MPSEITDYDGVWSIAHYDGNHATGKIIRMECFDRDGVLITNPVFSQDNICETVDSIVTNVELGYLDPYEGIKILQFCHNNKFDFEIDVRDCKVQEIVQWFYTHSEHLDYTNETKYFKITETSKQGRERVDIPEDESTYWGSTEDLDSKCGIYFTTEQYLDDFLEDGSYVTEVYLPKHDPEFRMIHDPFLENGRIFRANMVDFGKSYYIFDIDTIYRFELDDNVMISLSSQQHQFETLELLLDIYHNRNRNVFDSDYKNIDDYMFEIFEKCDVQTLEWFYNHPEYCEFFNDCENLKKKINYAASIGDVEMIQWFDMMSTELYYDHFYDEADNPIVNMKDVFEDAIDIAIKHDQTIVLDWFLRNSKKYGFEYDFDVLFESMVKGNIYVTNWFQHNTDIMKDYRTHINQTSNTTLVCTVDTIITKFCVSAIIYTLMLLIIINVKQQLLCSSVNAVDMLLARTYMMAMGVSVCLLVTRFFVLC